MDKLLGSKSFILFLWLEALTLKALLLMDLVSSKLVSELHSLIRKRSIAFGEHYNWVRLHPNSQFIDKNEQSPLRRGPILTMLLRIMLLLTM